LEMKSTAKTGAERNQKWRAKRKAEGGQRLEKEQKRLKEKVAKKQQSLAEMTVEQRTEYKAMKALQKKKQRENNNLTNDAIAAGAAIFDTLGRSVGTVLPPLRGLLVEKRLLDASTALAAAREALVAATDPVNDAIKSVLLERADIATQAATKAFAAASAPEKTLETLELSAAITLASLAAGLNKAAKSRPVVPEKKQCERDARVFGVDDGGDDNGGDTHNNRSATERERDNDWSATGQLSVACSTERERDITAAIARPVVPEKKQCGGDTDNDGGDTRNDRSATGQLSVARSATGQLSVARSTERERDITAAIVRPDVPEKTRIRAYYTLPRRNPIPPELSSTDDSRFGELSDSSSDFHSKPEHNLKRQPKRQPKRKPKRQPKRKPKRSLGSKRVRDAKDNGNHEAKNDAKITAHLTSKVDLKIVDLCLSPVVANAVDSKVTEIVTNDKEDSLEKEAMQKLRATLVQERRCHMEWLFPNVENIDLVDNTRERFKMLASKPNRELKNKLEELENRLEGIPADKNETVVETVFIKEYESVDGDRESLSDKDVMAVVQRKGMLSDATLHFYSGLLTERDYARIRMNGGKRSGIFSCHFITLLLSNPTEKGINYDDVAMFGKGVPGTNQI
jgi:hypothetical protein